MHVSQRVICSITKSFSRSAIDSKQCKNVSRTYLINIFHFIWMHPNHSTHFDLFLCCCIVDLPSFLKSSLIHSNVCYLTIFCFLKLERKTNEGLFLIHWKDHFFIWVWEIICVIFSFSRVWQVINDSIENSLNSFVFISTSHKDWSKLQCYGLLSYRF